MEVTALKGSGGDVQHFAERIIAERGVRYGRVALILGQHKALPERTLDE
jgi:CopG family nickel-responsive transcriptional regulator